MKYLKTLSLAALAAMAMVIIAGVGSASATVLCKEDKNPCGSADFPAGTEIKIEELPENSLLWKWGKTTIDECTKSEIVGKTTNTGGSGSAVVVELSSFTWGSCSHSRELKKLGVMELDYKNGPGSSIGTITLKELEWKDGLCTYGHPNIDIGDVTKPETSSSYAIVDIDALYPLISGFGCHETTTFAATYRITTPKPLYISES